jgi:hypothetical protein
VGGLGKRPHEYALDLGFPPSASADLGAQQPESIARLERELDAFVVAGLDTLEHRLMAPRRE